MAKNFLDDVAVNGSINLFQNRPDLDAVRIVSNSNGTSSPVSITGISVSSVSTDQWVITAPGHNAQWGGYVTIAGVNPTGFNGTWLVGGVDSTTITIYQIDSTLTYVSGGTVRAIGNVLLVANGNSITNNSSENPLFSIKTNGYVSNVSIAPAKNWNYASLKVYEPSYFDSNYGVQNIAQEWYAYKGTTSYSGVSSGYGFYLGAYNNTGTTPTSYWRASDGLTIGGKNVITSSGGFNASNMSMSNSNGAAYLNITGSLLQSTTDLFTATNYLGNAVGVTTYGQMYVGTPLTTVLPGLTSVTASNSVPGSPITGATYSSGIGRVTINLTYAPNIAIGTVVTVSGLTYTSGTNPNGQWFVNYVSNTSPYAIGYTVGGAIGNFGGTPTVTTSYYTVQVNFSQATALAIGDSVTVSGLTYTGTNPNGTFVITNVSNSGTLFIQYQLATNPVITGYASAKVAVVAQASITPRNLSTSGLVIKGVTSQTADLLQTQTSAGTANSGTNAVGQTYTGSTTPIYSSVGIVYSVQINTTTQGQINFVSATNLAVNDLVVVAAASGTSIIPAATYIVTGVLNSATANASYIQFALVGATVTAATTTASSLPASVTAPAQASITARSAGTKGLVIKLATSGSASPFEIQDSSGGLLAAFGTTGGVRIASIQALNDGLTGITLQTGRNVGFASASPSFGGGSGVIGISNASVAPSSNPTGGGVLYVSAGALNYIGTSGSARTLVNADGTLSLGIATATTINGTTIPSSATLVTTSTTSLSNLSSVNNTPIPSSATLYSGNTVIINSANTNNAATGVGYMGLPQNATTIGAYTIVVGDAGTHVYASATRTVTIPANSSVAFPIGTTLTFIAGTGATMTISINTDTLYLAGAGTTGSRTLAAYGMATAVKITSTSWMISGNGLT
jgi:hypothetical protein